MSWGVWVAASKVYIKMLEDWGGLAVWDRPHQIILIPKGHAVGTGRTKLDSATIYLLFGIWNMVYNLQYIYTYFVVLYIMLQCFAARFHVNTSMRCSEFLTSQDWQDLLGQSVDGVFLWHSALIHFQIMSIWISWFVYCEWHVMANIGLAIFRNYDEQQSIGHQSDQLLDQPLGWPKTFSFRWNTIEYILLEAISWPTY